MDDPAQLVAQLPDLLAAADVAAVLVRLKETDQRTMISRLKQLAPPIQNGGAALLVEAMSSWWRVPAPMARISPGSRHWRKPCRR